MKDSTETVVEESLDPDMFVLVHGLPSLFEGPSGRSPTSAPLPSWIQGTFVGFMTCCLLVRSSCSPSEEDRDVIVAVVGDDQIGFPVAVQVADRDALG